jgi:hypothetical protein
MLAVKRPNQTLFCAFDYRVPAGDGRKRTEVLAVPSAAEAAPGIMPGPGPRFSFWRTSTFNPYLEVPQPQPTAPVGIPVALKAVAAVPLVSECSEYQGRCD